MGIVSLLLYKLYIYKLMHQVFTFNDICTSMIMWPLYYQYIICGRPYLYFDHKIEYGCKHIGILLLSYANICIA